MRLSGVSFENYRSFVSRAKLTLRPLTLLFGYNSAGKSAGLRFLPLISADGKSGDPIAMDSVVARGATFRDLLSRQGSAPILRFGLTWESPESSPVELNTSIRYLADRQMQVVDAAEARFGAETVEALWEPGKSGAATKSQVYRFRRGEATDTVNTDVRGFVLRPRRARQTIESTFRQLEEKVGELTQSVEWLSSLRKVSARSYRYGPSPRSISFDGSNAQDFLAHDALGDGKLLEETSQWFERITEHRLSLRRFAAANDEQYAVMVAPRVGPLEVPIVDTGEGMSQVLPVIVLGALARLGRLREFPILAIEHPELHLHPAGHSALATFFCDLVSSTSSTLIVETHSENFLLRVQIAVARGQIKPTDVAIHWVRELDDGSSVIDAMTFDADARIVGDGWPSGVFGEDVSQARELLRLRQVRS